jgi:NAD(P)-dependent dehydrogenase (short-subunit alcohol dehydrogenase family)
VTGIALNGAVVAITGGGRGIGLAAAKQFAARGATVCIGDLDGERAADAAQSAGDRVHPFMLDVRSLESFQAFAADVERTAGPIDVLVNNAGVMPAGRFLDETETTTAMILGVNVAGPVHGMRVVLPGMIERRRGHVVNVASMLGKTELPGLATYTASKHAVVGLSAAVRQELDGTGVTLTAVLPSVVNTELASGIRLPPGFARILRVEPEDVARAIVASCASTPRELAVPRWLAVYPMLRPFIPPLLEDAVRRLVGHDRAVRAAAAAGRADYESRVAGQAAPRAAELE